jgi:hypothetical protein
VIGVAVGSATRTAARIRPSGATSYG